MPRVFGRWFAATLVLTTLLLIVAGVVRAIDAPPRPDMLAWTLFSQGLTAACMLGLAAGAPWSGRVLASTLFTVHFGISHVASLIEAYFFDLIEGRIVTLLLAQNALICAFFAVFVARLSRPRRRTTAGLAPQPGTISGDLLDLPQPWRVANVAVLYTVVYLTAGVLVLPFVQPFYAGSIPPLAKVIPMQLFIRGPMFALLIALVLRMVRASRLMRALAAAGVLSVLGGIAPLIVPNPVLPDHVRLAHLVEVSTSNFVFGALAALLLSGPALARAVVSTDLSRA
jgi:hypothetical protein